MKRIIFLLLLILMLTNCTSKDYYNYKKKTIIASIEGEEVYRNVEIEKIF